MLLPLLRLVPFIAIFNVPCTALNLGASVEDSAAIDYGTFENPAVHVRPRFRYVVPDASVDTDGVAADIGRVGDVGSGGIELLGYPSASGGTLIDNTKYAWGGKAWQQLLKVSLRTTKSLGLLMDVAIGPFQGAGVPAKPDDEGVQWDLAAYNVSVPIGGSFDNILPGWLSGKFVSASVGMVVDSASANLSSTDYFSTQYYNGTRYVLAESTLEDVTAKVAANGSLSYQFPTEAEGLEYQVFAFYEVRSQAYELDPPNQMPSSVEPSPITSYVENGSYVADHFSEQGADMIIDFWESQLLDNETRQLFKEVGNYLWEDSYEFGSQVRVWYTPGLLDAFKANRGYSFNKYLPLIFAYNTQFNGPLPSIDQYFTNGKDGGQAYLDDYHQTLNELNALYLRKLNKWAESSLSCQFSAQVVYNLPMDMLANVPSVDAPEIESLGGNDLIDVYRQSAGPANLAGSRVVSNELGASRGEAYSQTITDVIWSVKRSIAGSVNQMVYHIYPWSGQYPNTTYPGYTVFTYLFSAMHGPRQPAWVFYGDFMNWTARTQYIAQSGMPKVDLAIWLKDTSFATLSNKYLPSDLEAAGFTYEYLSPDNFDLPKAVVGQGLLAPERQSFKALILRGNDTLTAFGARKLIDFAHAGLPVVFSGGMPQNFSGPVSNATRTSILGDLTSLLDLPNVHSVPYEDLAASLAKLNVTPRVGVKANRVWNVNTREDKTAARTYLTIYNDAAGTILGSANSEGELRIENTGVPYTYNCWSGIISPIQLYWKDERHTVIPLALKGNESTVIAFHHDETAGEHTNSAKLTRDMVESLLYDQPRHETAVIKANQSSEIARYTNGSQLPEIPGSITLGDWKLVVESWTPPTINMSSIEAVKSNTSYEVTSLEPWHQLSTSLRNVSGRGFYSTKFSWPPVQGGSEVDGAILDLGALTCLSRVSVNGHQLAPLDPTNPIADLGPYLVNGTNDVDIILTTTLGNSLRPVWEDLRTSGTPAFGPVPAVEDNGLVLPVTVKPYRTVTFAP